MNNKPYSVGDLIYQANIYDGLNNSLKDFTFYSKWLPKNKNAKILELGCGTGRITIPISKKGYHHVTGVDFTSSMLAKAKSKAHLEGLNISFIQADIRSLNLSRKFDTIIFPFNAIHHLYESKDIGDTLNAVKKHIHNNGYFIFDCFNPNLHLIVDGEQKLKKLAEYTTKDGRQVMIKQKMAYESHTQINRIEWHFYINGQFDSVQNMDMRLYFPQELNYILNHHGFDIIQKFGSFDEDPFGPNSQKQIFVCQPTKQPH